MARVVHPDRPKNIEKDEFSEKFKVLQKVHAVLTDANKRRIYDETGIIHNDEGPRVFIVSDEQMMLSRDNYVGTEKERQAIREAYTTCNGNISRILKSVPFILSTDKPRIMAVINEIKLSPVRSTNTIHEKNVAKKRKVVDAEVDDYCLYPKTKKTKRLEKSGENKSKK